MKACEKRKYILRYESINFYSCDWAKPEGLSIYFHFLMKWWRTNSNVLAYCWGLCPIVPQLPNLASVRKLQYTSASIDEVHAHNLMSTQSRVCLIMGPAAQMTPATYSNLFKEVTKYIFISHIIFAHFWQGVSCILGGWIKWDYSHLSPQLNL